ncbi:MAG: gliding motility-associated C-terminal domain-containing protein, partial [Crocinitomicaceae bacterium]|nr:gliding motility-associated C-terminal domain-containing protein [Crocinitomicaceae bacterium]
LMTVTGTVGGTFSFNTAPLDAAVIDPVTGTVTGGTSGGTYDILYTTSGICPDNSTQTITALAADVATFTTTPTCDGGTVLITGTTGGVFSFNTAPIDAAVIDPTTGVITGGTPGTTYDILYTTGGACSANATQTVTALTADVATFTTLASCDGGTMTITGTTGGTFSFNTAPLDAAVIDPSTGQVSGGTSGTTYDILYTTAGVCSANSTQTVTALVQDDASFTATGTCDGGTMTITGTTGGTFSFNTPPLDAAVIDPITGGVTLGTPGASYDVTYTTGGVCPDLLTQTLTVLTTDDAGFTTIASCDGGTMTVTGTSGGTFSFNTAPLDAAVIDPSTGTVTGGTSGTTYDILYTTSGACPATSTQTVTAVVADDATFTTTPSCDGGTVTLTGTPGGTFSFNVLPSDAATIDPVTGTVSGGTPGGTYSIEYTTPGLCPSALVVNVTALLTPIIDVIADQTVCDQYVLPIITGTNLSGSEAFYDNSQLLGGTAITGPITSSQTVYVFDSNAGCSAEVSFLVTVNITEDASFTLTDYCEGDANSANITGVSGGTFAIMPVPSDGAVVDASTGEITGGIGGTSYNIQYTTSGPCPSTTTEMVTVNSIPLTPTVSSDQIYCTANPMSDMTATGSGGILTWYDDSGLSNAIGTGGAQPPFSSVGVVTYYVTESILGCESVPGEIIITIENCDIIVPTAITPDGDGVNDDWELVNIDNIYPNNVVRVYNRWGSAIYQSAQGDYNNSRWDGTYQGQLLPVGSYYFVIEFNDDNTKNKTGSVSIILGK